ncbi:MAG TPA: aspartate kinase, partial [Armatimonadota bacterium]|nr:aspartate kinase [Armatimonadota bacterium]
MIADEAGKPLRQTGKPARAAFEKERGVTAVSLNGPYAHLSVELDPAQPHAAQELDVYRTLEERRISINLVKLHRGGLSFVVDETQADAARDVLTRAGFRISCRPSVSMASVYAAGMRGLSGVMARIAGALLRAGVSIVQTGDGPDTVFCLVPTDQAACALEALRDEFQIAPEPRPIVVQKFGGRSVGTAEARRLAAERVKEALDAGFQPVVVVSAIGRMGEPYATDTLLSHLDAVDPATEPNPRERDMLMACGELISTVIMAQTLKSAGLRAVALSGGQAGIFTDYKYGDAQILDIQPDYIQRLLESGDVDVVVVAGFQGVTDQGAITTLGRGGSDTTASALGAALGAAKVEIYTHVDGVMTADPEVVPSAHTLPMVTYEEVCNMAHQGAKVLHPRAAEVAMLHQIPLWVKSSFVRSPGTLVAPLAQIQPPTRRAVTGVATISRLASFTLASLRPESRAETEFQVFRAVGDAGINFYLNSEGPDTASFLVDQSFARQTAQLLDELGLPHD